MEAKGQVMMSNYDSQVYVPISTAMDRLFNQPSVSTLLAQASSSERAAEAVKQVAFFLVSRLGSTEGIRVTSQDQMLEMMSQVTATMQLLLGAVASISLVVGGIGVMNIMLVSVTERTAEIGTRKALGAKQSDILLQFIVESLILSLLGGFFGLFTGILIAHWAANYGGWPVRVEISAVIIAVTFSAVIGLLAGVYPARQAAKLDPVRALSYE